MLTFCFCISVCFASLGWFGVWCVALDLVLGACLPWVGHVVWFAYLCCLCLLF